MPPSSPLISDVSQMPLARCGGQSDNFINKWLKNTAQTDCNFRSQMEPKWRHKSDKCQKMVNEIHAASRESKHAHKNGRPSWIADPIKVDFDALAYTGAQFALFYNWLDCDQIGVQRLAKSRPWNACRSKKMEVERSRKHVENVTRKVPTSVTNMSQKEGLAKWSFCGF